MSVRLGRAGGVPRLFALAVLGALMLALQLRLRGDGDVRAQVAGQCVATAIFVAALALAWRRARTGWATVALVLLFAAAFRGAAFVPADRTPPLSTDVHRYAWDGRVQLAGINPYRYSPRGAELARLRDGAIWPGINRKHWRTIYPPGAEATFAASQAAFGDSLRSTTWALLLAEGASAGLLILALRRMRAPPERVIAYAWHPLAISEIAGNGHVDALAILGLSGLLAAWTYRRRVVAGAALALAALVKLGPLLLVPALARAGGRRFAVAAVGIVALAYIPYALTIGTGVLGSLGRFEREERFNGSLDSALSPLIGRETSRIVLAAGLLVLVAVVAVRAHESVEQVARSGLLVLGGLLLAVDYVQPWHALWLTPFLAIVAAPGWLWLTCALPVAYVRGFMPELPLWATLVVYGPLGIWVAWRVLAPARPSRALPALPRRTRIVAVIPALNEGVALRGLLADWPAAVVGEVVVVDGGSDDDTVEVARAAGARVVVEPRRGYGRACATGAAAAEADVVVFLDGDGSCDPADIPAVLEPVLTGRAALCLGSRVRREAGAMPWHQRLGNLAVAAVLRVAYGARVGDVPCLRAIRADTLADLDLRDTTYGWPTEMIVRAARERLPIVQVPVSFRRRRGGESKVAGRIGPSARAGARMLAVALRDA